MGRVLSAAEVVSLTNVGVCSSEWTGGAFICVVSKTSVTLTPQFSFTLSIKQISSASLFATLKALGLLIVIENIGRSDIFQKEI